MKENIAGGSLKHFDSEDNSWTRPKQELLSLIKEAGMEVLLDKKQLNFPKGIYEVRMLALRADRGISELSENSS